VLNDAADMVWDVQVAKYAASMAADTRALIQFTRDAEMPGYRKNTLKLLILKLQININRGLDQSINISTKIGVFN